MSLTTAAPISSHLATPHPPDATGPQFVGAAEFEGSLVLNLQHQLLGKVHSVMIDRPSGRIAYIVMSHGGMFGVADKLFAIPWQVLKWEEGRRCLLLDIDREHLGNAPSFDPPSWPAEAADPEWINDLHRYFGSTPPDDDAL